MSRLINFVCQHQNTAKHVASGKLTIPLTKQTEKSLESVDLVFLITIDHPPFAVRKRLHFV